MIQTIMIMPIINEAATIKAFDKTLSEPCPRAVMPIINIEAAINRAIKESGFIVSP